MVPNPHWPGEKPHFKRVSVKIIGESASRRLQLSRGDLDIADALPVDQLAALKQEGKVAVAEYPSLRVTYLYLNNSKPPMNQVDLRRAVSGRPIIRDGERHSQRERQADARPDPGGHVGL